MPNKLPKFWDNNICIICEGNEEYEYLKRLKDLDSDDSVTGSSNFGKFIKLFESDNSSWIEKINRSLEE